GGGARPVPVPAPRGRPRSRLVVDARVQRATPPRFPRRSDARRGPPAVRGKFYFCAVCLTGKLTRQKKTTLGACGKTEARLGMPKRGLRVPYARRRCTRGIWLAPLPALAALASVS